MISIVGWVLSAHSTTRLLPYLRIVWRLIYLLTLLSCMFLRGRDYMLFIFINPGPQKDLGIRSRIKGQDLTGDRVLILGTHMTLCFLSSLCSLITRIMNKLAWFVCSGFSEEWKFHSNPQTYFFFFLPRLPLQLIAIVFFLWVWLTVLERNVGLLVRSKVLFAECMANKVEAPQGLCRSKQSHVKVNVCLAIYKLRAVSSTLS